MKQGTDNLIPIVQIFIWIVKPETSNISEKKQKKQANKKQKLPSTLKNFSCKL